MTASDDTHIPDEAVDAFIGGYQSDPHVATYGEAVRAGLAAALPWLADAIRDQGQTVTAPHSSSPPVEP